MPSVILDALKIFVSMLPKAWLIFKIWWWLPLPFILWRPFSFLWRWWRTDKFTKERKFILLEIKIPKEVLKPIRAMEVVIDGLWQILYDPADWWEKWVEGKVLLSYSFEIASIGGEPHFFIRIPESSRDSVESAVYSQYPDAEILIAEDYTKYIPQDIPNKDWDLWAADYRLLKENPYPIKTYTSFETEREPLEEKRIDPLANLLEAMAKIKPGEQLWIQILAGPVSDLEVPWVTEGEKIRDKLAGREKESKTSFLGEAVNILFKGVPPGYEETKQASIERKRKGGIGERRIEIGTTGKTSIQPIKKEKAVIPAEMQMTPGEREIISAIEEKIAKRGFQTSIRFIYLGKKDVFFKPKLRLPLSFFSVFFTQNINALVPWGDTLTKIHKSWFLPINLLFNRRLYLRKRSIFRRYKSRHHPLFPRTGRQPSSFILNTEEIATLFHFPGRRVAQAPFIKRIEAKKGEAPPGLPTG